MLAKSFNSKWADISYTGITTKTFKKLQAFKHDKSYVVWSSIYSSISKIQNLVADTDYFDSFRLFILDLMSEILKTVGWEKAPGETHIQGLLRDMILVKMGTLGHPETLAEARY